MNPEQTEITVKATDEVLQGRYANQAQITQTPEEIIIDFLLISPPVGQFVSRIVMSTGHAKRLTRVLNETISKIEKQIGEKITESEEPRAIGFKNN